MPALVPRTHVGFAVASLRRASALFLSVVAFLMAAGSARATQIIYVRANAPEGGNGSSWAAAFSDLHSAIAAANPSSSDPVEIWIATGVYRASPLPSQSRFVAFPLRSYTTFRGGFAGTETAASQRPAAATATAFTVLSGDVGNLQSDTVTASTDVNNLAAANFDATQTTAKDNCYNVVRCVSATGAYLDRLVIAGGYADSTDVSAVQIESMLVPSGGDGGGFSQDINSGVTGGGLYLSNSDVGMTNCWFVGNFSRGSGGAVVARGGSLSVADCKFVRNFSGYAGGGMCLQATTLWSFERNEFYGNTAAFLGGGLLIQADTDNKTVKSFEGAALLSMGALEVSGGDTFPAGSEPDPKIQFNLTNTLADSFGIATTLGQIVLEKKGLISPSLLESPLTLYAEQGAFSVVGAAYGWISAVQATVDLAVQIALIAGANPDDPFIVGWTKFTDGFNAYATPLGLYHTFVDFLNSLSAPSFEERAYNLRNKDYADNQNHAHPFEAPDNRFTSNYAKGFGGGVVVLRANVVFNRTYFTENNAGFGGGGAASFGYNEVNFENTAFIRNRSPHGHSAFLSAFRSVNRIINNTIVGNYSGTDKGYAVGADAGADVSLMNTVLWDNANGDRTSADNPNRYGGADLWATRHSDLDAAGIRAYDQAGDARGAIVAVMDVQHCDVESLNRLAPGIAWFFGGAPYDFIDEEGSNIGNQQPNIGEGIRVTRGNISKDPMFIQDIYPLLASPVIDAGYHALFDTDYSRDIGKAARNYDQSFDMGAVESQGRLPPGVTLYVNAAAATTGDGLSWATAFKTMPEALAVPLSPGSQIWVAAGTYYPTAGTSRSATMELCEGVSLIGSLPVGATSIDQSDPALHPTIVSGNIGSQATSADNSSVLLRGTGFTFAPDTLTTLPRLIRGFRFTGANSNEAAVHLAVPVTIQNCTFDQNAGARALLVDDPGQFAYRRTTSISDCLFEANTAGALQYEAVQVDLIRCKFFNNTAASGAAVLQEPAYNVQSALKLERCVFAFNNATAGRGGAVRSLAASLDIAHTDIVYNTATPVASDTSTLGGAGFWWDTANLGGTWSTVNSIFYGNRLLTSTPVTNLEYQQFGPKNVQDYQPVWVNRTFKANDIEGLTALAPLEGSDGNVDYDPFFNDSPFRDFSLRSGSPLINGGAAYSSGSDATTVITGTRDIGVVESSIAAATALQTVGLTVPKPTTAGRQYTISLNPPTASPVTYIWEVRRPGDTRWSTVSSDAYTSGFSTGTLTLRNPPRAWNGSLYRVKYFTDTWNYSATISVSVQPGILYVKTSATGTGDGNSWANAMTLADALQIATPYTSIWIASGTYPLGSSAVDPATVPPGVRIYGGFSGTETTLTGRPTSGAVTNLTGGYGAMVLKVTGTATWPADSSAIPTVVDGVSFVVTANAFDSDPIIQTENADTLFNNVTNATPYTTARIHNGQALFTHCVVRSARAIALAFDTATAQVSDCSFTNNLAGAIASISSTTALADSEFVGNVGGLAGAVYSSGSSGSLDVQRCTFIGNTSADAGGAITVLNSAASRIINSALVRNVAGTTGGAIATGSGTVTVSYSTLAANVAPYAAGIDAGGTVLLANSIVWDNLATSPGSNGPAVNGSVTSNNSTVQGVSSYAPVFDPNSVTYALSANSPLLNTGDANTTQTGATDVGGRARLFGSAIDPGANEYQGAAGTPVYLTAEPPAQTTVWAEEALSYTIAGNVGSSSGGGTFGWEYWNGAAWVAASGLSGAVVTAGTNSSTLSFASVPTTPASVQFRATASGVGAVRYATLSVTPRRISYVDRRAPQSSGNGLTWATAWSDIDNALIHADSKTDIWIAGGDYSLYESSLPAGAHVYVGFAGNETAVAQRDPSLYPVRIYSGLANVFRIVVPTVSLGLPGFSVSTRLNDIPTSTTVIVDEPAKFTANVLVPPATVVSWEYLAGSTWTPISNLAGWTVSQAPHMAGGGLDVSTLAKSTVALTESGLRVRAVVADFGEYSAAATLTVVPRSVLYVNGAVAASGNGASWTAAFKTIGEAITAATAQTDIWIAGGDYPAIGVTPLTGTRFYVGFAGTETSVDARNPGLRPVRIAATASFHTLVPTASAALPTFTTLVTAAPANASPYVAKPVSFTAQSNGNLAWEYFNGSTWVSIAGLSGWFVGQSGTTSTASNLAIPPGQTGTQIRAAVQGSSSSEVTFAATLTVKPRVTRYVNGTVAASGAGTSWATAFKTIGEALAVADNGTDIWIAGGTYPENPFTLVVGTNIYGGFAGGETNVNARDLVAHPVLLQGGGSSIDLTSVLTAGALTYHLASPPRASPLNIGEPGRVSITRTSGSSATLVWQYYDGAAWQPIASLAGWSVTTSGSLSSIVSSAVPQTQDGVLVRVLVSGTAEVSFTTTLLVKARTTLYVNGAIASSGNGASWGTAFKTVAAALAVADSNTDLRIAQGTYDEAVHALPAGAKIYGGFASGDAALTARNPATHPVILRNSTGNRLWSLNLTGTSADLVTVIDSITLDGSTADAAAYVTGGTVLFSGVTFSNNTAALSLNGAAVFTVDTCTFTTNTTSLVIASGPSVAVVGSTFTGGGSAIQSAAGVALLVSGSTFTNQANFSLQAAPGAAVESSTFSGAPRALVITGAGTALTSILQTSFAGHATFAVQSATAVTINDGTFNTSTLGLDLTASAANSLITASHFTGNTHAVHAPAGLTVTNTAFNTNGKGLVFTGGTTAVSTVTGSTFSGNTTAGIESAGALQVSGATAFSDNVIGLLVTGSAATTTVGPASFTHNTTGIASPGGLAITGATFSTNTTGIALSGGAITPIKTSTFTGETGTAITAASPVTIDTDTFTNCANGIAISGAGSGGSTIARSTFTGTTGVPITAIAGVTVTNSAISSGTTGLAIGAAGSAATSTISDSTFSGLSMAGISAVDTLALSNDTFTACALGVTVTGGAATQVTGTTFRGNVAGLRIAYPAGLTLTDSLFTANSGTSVQVTQQTSGGRDTGITGTRFLGNTGPVFAQTNRAFTFNRCIVLGNTAASSLITGTGVSVMFYNTLIAQNTTAGSTIATSAETGTREMIACTIADNSTGSAVGVLAPQFTFNITQSILWGNRSSGTSAVESMQQPVGGVTITQSVIEGLASALRTMPAAQDSSANPLFVDAPAGNYTLGAYSAAIDAGGATFAGNTLDLAGNARVQSAAVDLGAYESSFAAAAQPLAVTFTPSSPAIVVDNTVTLNVGFATSAGYTIRWQVNTGTSWTDLASNSLETSSYANNTLSLLLTGNLTLNGRKYRAVIALNGTDIYTTPAWSLTVTGRATIYVNVAATGANNGTSWTDAYTSLATALAAAPAFTDILVAAGTYRASSNAGFPLRRQQRLVGAYTAGTTARDPVNTPTILAAPVGAPTTAIILASQSDQGTVDAGTLIDGFTFQEGGIGLQLTTASPAVRNCRFQSLVTGIKGGPSQLVVDNCSFTGHTTSAIRLTGPTTTLQVSNSAFTGNSVATTDTIGGGAIGLGDSSAPNGGGQTIVIVNSTFTGNSAKFGGAISAFNWASNITLTRCTFTTNSVTDSGGAIRATTNSTLLVRDTLLARNAATRFGAAINTDGAATLVYATVADNTSSLTSSSNGAVSATGTLTVRDSILWGNTAGTGSAESAQLIGSTTGSSYSDSIIQSLRLLSGTRLLPFDPRFVNSTGSDYRLAADSPAIGAGNPADLSADETDLLLVARPAGSAPDLGAFETSASPAPTYALATLPASVSAYAGTNLTLATQNFPTGYTGAWQYNTGTSGWVTIAENTGMALLGPPGALTTNITTSTSARTSQLSLTGLLPALDGTALRYVLASGANTFPSSAETITILPFQVMYVDASRPASGNGTSWATAYQTIGEALTAVDSARRVLYVAEGTYRGPFQIPMRFTMYGGFPAGGGDLTSRSPAGHPTILEGLAADGVTHVDPVVRLVFSSTGYVQPVIDGFVVENGLTGMSGDSGVSPTLRNLVVRGNSTTGLVLQNSQATVEDSLFENNTGANGGAIRAQTSVPALAPTFDRLIVRGNSATSGGGLYLQGNTVVRNTLLTGNVATTGGAVYSASGATQLTQATLAGNRATAAPAVHVAGGAVTLNNSLVSGNRATQGTANVQFGSAGGGSLVFNQVIAEQAPTTTGVTIADPYFVLPIDAAAAPTTAGDYRLRVISSAIDAGNSTLATGLTLDVARQARVVGTTVDVGAYESAFTGVTPLAITAHPTALSFGSGGANAFSVTTTGAVSILWQYAPPAGSPWTSLDGVAGFSGAVTNTLTVTTAPTSSLNGYRFRALVTGVDGTVITSGEATLAVFTARFYVNAGRSGSDAGDGLSWETAFRSLDTALAAAPADPAGTDYWIAAGTYTPANAFAVRSGLRLYGGFAGGETSLPARDPNTNVTALVGAASKPNVLLTSVLSSVPLPLRLDGLTIRTSTGTGLNNAAGCAMEIEGVKFTGLSVALTSAGGALNFRHSEVRGSGGGGVVFNITGGSVLIENSLFAGNNPGATYLAYLAAPAVVRHTTFASNHGQLASLYYANPSNETYNCVFWGNRHLFSGVSLGTFSLDSSVRLNVVRGNVLENLSTVEARSPVSFESNSAADPQFPAPLDYSAAPFTGGTFTLGTASLAIDTGRNEHTSSDGLDLAGNARQHGLYVDPGAYEYQADDLYAITAHPAAAFFSAVSASSFTVGTSRPATFAWEVSADGTNFTPIAGATGATLTVPANVGAPGYSYRARVQFTTGPLLVSNAASFVSVAVTASADKPAGFATPAQFSAAASASVSGWQWQVSTDGTNFTNVAGATSATLQVSGNAANTNQTYRAQATFAAGAVVASNAVAFAYADVAPSSASAAAAAFTLSGGVQSSSVSDASVTVLPQFGKRLSLTAGILTATISGNNVSFAAHPSVAAGSRVFVTLNSALRRADGIGTRPQVWEYRAPTVSGDGAFVAPTMLSSAAATTLAAGDVDGDATIDLLVADAAGLRLWRNNGLGAFTADAASFGAANARAIALASLRGLSALDAVVITSAGDVQIWTNDGTGAFTLAQTLAALSARALALGDLDGDGDADLFVTTASGNRVYFNNGAAAFTLSSSFDLAAGTAVELGDFNNDGALDAVVASSTSTKVWTNDGLGTFTSVLSTATVADRVAVADFDNDGRLDFILTRANQPTRIWRNLGSSQFTLLANTPGGGAATLAAGDVDGDGRIDLVLTDATGTTAPWLTSASLASVVAADQPLLRFGNATTLVDLDGDGALDLIGVDASGHAAVALYHVTPTKLDEDSTSALAAAGFTPAPDQVILVSLPASGTLLNGSTAVNVGDTFTLSAAAALTYRPNANFAGADSFTWSATAGGAARTYRIFTREVFDLVGANADALTAIQGATTTKLTGNGTSVLANDGNVDVGTTLTAAVVTAPTHGALTLNSDGTFNYVHDNSIATTDSFVYRATNALSGLFADATVTITIVPANVAPTAIALTATSGTHYTGHAAETVATLAATDADAADAGLHTFTLVTGTGATNNADFTIVGSALQTAGPIDASLGLTRSIRVRAADPGGLTYEQAFTVAFTRAPTPTAASVSTAEDTALAVTLAGTGGAASLTYAVVDTPAHGILSGTAPNLTFTPAANYYGADAFTFRVSDGTLTSAAATVAITVTGVNDAPTLDAIANPGTVATNSSAQTVTLTGISAGGGENQTLTVTATSGNTALIPNPTVTYTSPNATGSLSFTPATNATGTAVITVTVKDNGGGGTDTFSRSFTVTVASNAVPTLDAIANPATLAKNAGAQTVNLTGISAGGGESQALTVTAASSNTAVIPNPTITYTSPGTAGSLRFTPVANATGTAVITVTVKDNGGGGTDTIIRTFTVTVVSINNAPTLNAIADRAAVDASATGQFVPINGISDGDGGTQTLTLTAISSDPGLVANPQVLWSNPNASGGLLYTPSGGGTVTITVTLKDNGGTANGGADTIVRTFTVTVNPVDDPNPPALTIGARTGGGVTLQIAGSQKASYQVSYSTDLTHWTALTNVITDNSGAATVEDPASPAEGAARFYRARRN